MYKSKKKSEKSPSVKVGNKTERNTKYRKRHFSQVEKEKNIFQSNYP